MLFTNCSFSSEEIEKLKNKGIEVVAEKENLTQEELIKALQGFEGYIMGGTDRAPKEVIDATNLKIINFYGAGYQDYIDIPTANSKSIVVANTPKANSYTVAEHTAAMILEGVKNITWLNNTTKEGNWFRRRTWNLFGKTLGIVGMGTIGTHVATIMKNAFNMNIVYTSRIPKLEAEKQIGARKITLDELLKQSDVISIHASLNEKTTNMIDEKELMLLKRTAVLVNMARAKIVNGTALKKALKEGWFAKAVFDCYYEEPSPTKENDKLGLLSLDDDKFVITPHTAYNTKEAFENMNSMVIENLIAFSKGESVPYKVN